MGVRIEHTDDYVAIRRLQLAYADSMSRRAYGELNEIFLPDTSVEIVGRRGADGPLSVTGPGAFGALVESRIQHLEFFQFIVLNAVVEFTEGDPDQARGRVHICELWKYRDGRSSELFGLYSDDYRKVDDSWWYARRRFDALGLSDHRFKATPYPNTDS